MNCRFLDPAEAETRASVGRRIEQWLSHSLEAKCRFIRWLLIEKEPSGEFTVVLREVFDKGRESLDFYGFPSHEPDLPLGEIASFDAFDEAMAFARRAGAQPELFVASGI